jgi:hypothetical protein
MGTPLAHVSCVQLLPLTVMAVPGGPEVGEMLMAAGPVADGAGLGGVGRRAGTGAAGVVVVVLSAVVSGAMLVVVVGEGAVSSSGTTVSSAGSSSSVTDGSTEELDTSSPSASEDGEALATAPGDNIRRAQTLTAVIHCALSCIAASSASRRSPEQSYRCRPTERTCIPE